MATVWCEEFRHVPARRDYVCELSTSASHFLVRGFSVFLAALQNARPVSPCVEQRCCSR